MFPERLHSPEHFFKVYKPSTDNDGVLCDLKTTVVKEFNRMFKTERQPDEIRGWQTIVEWSMELGMSKEEGLRVDNYLWYDPDLVFRALPIAGAKDFTRAFAERGIDLTIITSRPSHLREVTKAWFELHMPWIEESRIVMRKSEDLEGDIFKTWMIPRLGIGIHFEDSTTHAKNILDYTDARVVLLSNSGVLDYYPKDRLKRFSGRQGLLPDMRTVNKTLFYGLIS